MLNLSTREKKRLGTRLTEKKTQVLQRKREQWKEKKHILTSNRLTCLGPYNNRTLTYVHQHHWSSEPHCVSYSTQHTLSLGECSQDGSGLSCFLNIHHKICVHRPYKIGYASWHQCWIRLMILIICGTNKTHLQWCFISRGRQRE